MTEREMFLKSFKRPKNYFDLDSEEQYQIDKKLGILDWVGEGLTPEDTRNFLDHYNLRATWVLAILSVRR